MSKLEEVSSKRLILVDSFDAQKNHLIMLAFSLLIGVVYSFFLWFVCSTIPGVMSGLLLFGSQIAMGFPATRAYYDLGKSNRENLHFIDSAKFNNGIGAHHKVDINLGEIPHIFEKMDLQIQKFDKGSLDDLSDLAWFGIFVWAAYSSTSFFLGLAGYPLCLFGTVVFLLASFMSYVSGYRTRRDVGFGEDLSHLQYFVEKRLKDIDSSIKVNGTTFYVHVLEWFRSIVLVDFSAEVKIRNDTIMQYHMGLPSDKRERIVLLSDSETIPRISSSLADSPNQTTWHITSVDSPKGLTLEIQNESSDFSVDQRASFVKSPSHIDKASKETADIIIKVLSLIS
ncbi:MAG: hypothetical protein ACFFE2_07000 [Candidatus Thorarchaeota archaeon]